MRILAIPFLAIMLLSGCANMKLKSFDRKFVKGQSLDNHFIGFVLYDPAAQQYLLEKNADKYFTPASNTKLFTLYAGLKLLSDSLPGLMYQISGDSLIFRGTGDPTFLHRDFPRQTVYEFLKYNDLNLYFVPGYYDEPYFGPGWAWDDYQYGYQAEKSEFPMYGNFVGISQVQRDSFNIIPDIFHDYVELDPTISSRASRDLAYNIFNVNPNAWGDRKDTLYIPFKYSPGMVKMLLEDTLGKKVTILKNYQGEFTHSLKSRPAIEAYTWMMQASDNFLAEQLLIASSLKLGTKLRAANTIWHIKNKYLQGMVNEPIWIDGSGLSRYNLFTPRTMVQLTVLIYQELPKEQLYRILPAGGVSGTLKSWYKADVPYVFAKTGTLSNNHCLSGFIETKSGKTLIFSFMNNNFPGGSNAVKENMEQVLVWVRDRY